MLSPALGFHSILKELLQVQQSLGYCPQFDALFDELTAQEHLELYTRLRGIPWKDEERVRQRAKDRHSPVSWVFLKRRRQLLLLLPCRLGGTHPHKTERAKGKPLCRGSPGHLAGCRGWARGAFSGPTMAAVGLFFVGVRPLFLHDPGGQVGAEETGAG